MLLNKRWFQDRRWIILNKEEAVGILDKKVVLITGTGGGLGRVAVQTFAREGAKIVGCDIKVDANNETVELVRRAGGESIHVEPLLSTQIFFCSKCLQSATPINDFIQHSVGRFLLKGSRFELREVLEVCKK